MSTDTDPGLVRPAERAGLFTQALQGYDRSGRGAIAMTPLHYAFMPSPLLESAPISIGARALLTCLVATYDPAREMVVLHVPNTTHEVVELYRRNGETYALQREEPNR